MNDISSPSVNNEILECFDLDAPKSFFLFAGAGSGKTRSLVDVLAEYKINNIDRLRKRAQMIAIITYTNAACDEIKKRLDYDPSFHVTTIHSFSWELIQPYTHDIKEWIKSSLATDIEELKEMQEKATRTNTKTYLDRQKKIELKTARSDALASIRKFTYSPNGEILGRDSLSHAEVIAIAAHFLFCFPLMQSILVRTFPILLIDESQDTKKELIDAFFTVQESKSDCFSLGMFGDTMQRIYSDGKQGLGEHIPESWKKPVKNVNYRCPKRVVTLINKIRSEEDEQQQEAGKEAEGTVRFFVVNTAQSVDKAEVERSIAESMSGMTGDDQWLNDSAIKVLTLEHHMAAARGGFSRFFQPLHSVNKYKTGLLDGSLPGVKFFSDSIAPLIEAKSRQDDFMVANVIKKNSPLLAKDQLKTLELPIEQVKKASEAVEGLYGLWSGGHDPLLGEILAEINQSGLFLIPDVLVPIAERYGKDVPDDEDGQEPAAEAWENALETPFSEFKQYTKYISDESPFGTHQGIKGLEFPRVIVVLDDEEARGFMFSYDKLFGVKDPSPSDVKNEAEGKDTSTDRSRRLFYVTCSRAEESLAVIAYTNDPIKVKKHALEKNWFDENEIIVLGEAA